MTRNIFAFILMLFLAATALAENLPSLQSIRENNKGVDQLKASNLQMSQELFIRALQKNPHSPEIHLNLGVTFSQQNQSEKAEASYQTALRLAKERNSKFAALYNLGELAQKEKKKDLALEYYQQALKHEPKSIETKVNIELLAQSGKDGGDSKDDQKQDKQDQQDKKDQSGDGKDQKEQEPKEGDKDKEDQKKPPSKGKPQPKQFKSQELSQSDVNKILDELKQQEQKIRAEFNRRESKEKPRDKDW